MEFLNAYSDSDEVESEVEEMSGEQTNHEEEMHGQTEPQAAIVLPSALSAFDEVEGPPAFLNPEASRQFATLHPSSSSARATAPDSDHGKQKRQAPGPDFDISKLAPPLKGSKRDNGGSSTIDIRGDSLNPDAVITGQAKRYKLGAEQGGPQISLAQIAMLGGNLPNKSGGGGGSKALSVDEFLIAKGGSAQMPRKGQDRRDKEKEKRAKGQSAIGSWKSEAEMVLRQQFDS
jgi:hypothetical protein